jgi:hypothetical protein
MAHSTLALDDLPDKGVLAEPVHDAQGQLLLPAGTVLSTDLIAALRRRGIASAAIVLPGAQAGEGAPEGGGMQASRAQIDARMQRLFRHTAKTGQLNPLLHIVRRYRLGEQQ